MARSATEAAAEIARLALQISRDRETIEALRAELATTQARVSAADKIARAQAVRAELAVPASWRDLLDEEVMEVIQTDMRKKECSFEDACRALIRYGASRKRALQKYETSVADVKVRRYQKVVK